MGHARRTPCVIAAPRVRRGETDAPARPVAWIDGAERSASADQSGSVGTTASVRRASTAFSWRRSLAASGIVERLHARIGAHCAGGASHRTARASRGKVRALSRNRACAPPKSPRARALRAERVGARADACAGRRTHGREPQRLPARDCARWRKTHKSRDFFRALDTRRRHRTDRDTRRARGIADDRTAPARTTTKDFSHGVLTVAKTVIRFRPTHVPAKASESVPDANTKHNPARLPVRPAGRHRLRPFREFRYTRHTDDIAARTRHSRLPASGLFNPGRSNPQHATAGRVPRRDGNVHAAATHPYRLDACAGGGWRVRLPRSGRTTGRPPGDVPRATSDIAGPLTRRAIPWL